MIITLFFQKRNRLRLIPEPIVFSILRRKHEGFRQPNSFRLRINRNLLLVAAQTLELDTSVHQGVQSIILADADVGTGMDPGAALTVKNVTGLHDLTVRSLGAKTLGLGITAVLGRTDTLFMSE